jgi:glycerol kinase
MAQYAAALDQGTTSTRCMIFDHGGQVAAIEQLEHEQIYPKPGWVEHDPGEIWQRTRQVMDGALGKVGGNADDIAALGITNQRETTVVWDRNTGEPVYNAIVWQDTRTDKICDELSADEGQDRRSPPTSRGRRSAGSSRTSTARGSARRPATSSSATPTRGPSGTSPAARTAAFTSPIRATPAGPC